MAKKEANFDLYIHDLLVEAGIQADTQGSNIVPINDALKTASKHQTGKAGFPEYTAVVDDFVLVMEDKADRANLCLKDADGNYFYDCTGNNRLCRQRCVALCTAHLAENHLQKGFCVRQCW